MQLFKYANHFGANILQDLRLKVTPPNELNDPFEFSPYVPPGTVTEEYLQDLIRTTPQRQIYDEMAGRGYKLPSFEDFEALVRAAPADRVRDALPKFQSSYEHIMAAHPDHISRTYGLVCFSEEESNILMWSHYTDSHKGMLLEFDASHPFFGDNSNNLRKVNYSKKRVPFDPRWPEASPELHRFAGDVLTTKNDAWAYEREWRLLFMLANCHPQEDKGFKLYFTDIPPDLIRRVIFGNRCPLNVQEQVMQAQRVRGLKFTVWQAALHPTDFALQYKQL